MPSGDIPVLSEVFGSTPDVIKWKDIGLGDEQIKALQANLNAFGDIQNLGGKYYDYMLGFMDRSIPGFSDILSTGGDLTKKMQGTAAEFLGGQIPQDVIDQVNRSSAFQNLQSGLLGGSMGMSNTARNLGLTSLDMINKGVGLEQASGNAAQRWANIASGLVMNPASFFVTPEQQFSASVMNQSQSNAAKQLEENLKAAPSPVAKGISDTIINLVGAYLGAGKGGGGGGIAPSYSPTQYAGQTSGGVAGGQSTPFGGNVGGTNVYAATTGGFNFGGQNLFGTDIPYMGGSGMSDVSNPGYYTNPPVFNTTPYQSQIAPNPWGGG